MLKRAHTALAAATCCFTVLCAASGGAAADVTTFGRGQCVCVGVASDGNGVVYSADPNVHQVVQFAPDGSVLARWGRQRHR